MMKHYRLPILLFLAALIAAEMIWSWKKDKKVYQLKETFANMAILAGFQLSKLLFAGYQLTILGWFTDLTSFHFPNNAWTFAACFILADFCYYWFHRISHHTGNFDCGVTTDSSFSGSNGAGAAVTYNYAFGSSRTLTCDNGIPQQFAYQFTGSSSYTAPRISSDDSSAGQFTITGLQPAATQYTFNETYIRKGSETSLVGNQLAFTSTITIQASNLIVDKNTQQILSGTAAVSISGSTSGGKSFSYSGMLTFNGSQTATLVLGNGNTYSITWS